MLERVLKEHDSFLFNIFVTYDCDCCCLYQKCRNTCKTMKFEITCLRNESDTVNHSEIPVYVAPKILSF